MPPLKTCCLKRAPAIPLFPAALARFCSVYFRGLLPPPPQKQKKKEDLVLLHLGMALLELPFFPRGAEGEEKDCTRYLCLFIYSVNSSCAGALKRRRAFVR